MEIEGFKEAVNFLEKHDLLKKLRFIVADKDGKIAKYIRNESRLQHVKILNDPGHWMKGVANEVEKILGTGKEYKGFIPRIKRWFMYCIKEAETTIQKKYKNQDTRHDLCY